jgi:hypothetical protein
LDAQLLRQPTQPPRAAKERAAKAAKIEKDVDREAEMKKWLGKK